MEKYHFDASDVIKRWELCYYVFKRAFMKHEMVSQLEELEKLKEFFDSNINNINKES